MASSSRSAAYTRRFLFLGSVVWFFATASCSFSCKSSCGNLTNIVYPFRFRGDPAQCGKSGYELACEENRTILYMNPYQQGYNYEDPYDPYQPLINYEDPYDPYEPRVYVEAINYNNYTIRVVDEGIQKGNCSSLPLRNSFSVNSQLPLTVDSPLSPIDGYRSRNTVVTLLDCENPVVKQLPSLFPRRKPVVYKKLAAATTSDCRHSFFSDSRHSFYFLFGDDIRINDVATGCRIAVSTPVLLFANEHEQDHLSFPEFHDKLAFGYEISWISILCNCSESDTCAFHPHSNSMTVYCSKAVCSQFEGIQDIFRYCSWRSLGFLYNLLGYYLFKLWPHIVRTIGGIIAARTICGFLCTLAFVIYKYRRRNLSVFENIEDFLQSNNNLVPIRYTYSQIKSMTKGLKDLLGRGGFGSVYKGKLRSGAIVAIKILTNSSSSGRDFVNEVATIGRVHHTNVVRLIGFCVEGSKRALVYEFMPNGSLEKYIFSQEGTASLSCNQIFDISVGVARAIEYLHRGCEMQILHFDIKPHNILLDDNFNPKVSDFGLAKLYPAGKSMVTLTEARGTMGYIAPEMFYKNIGRVSYKADVYSFGMLLLEMAGRRKNLNVYADQTSQIYFPSWVYDEFKEGREVEMGEITDDEKKMTKKMIITAFWCTQMKPSDRPSMDRVLEMLEGDIELLEMPPKPSLNPQEMLAEAI